MMTENEPSLISGGKHIDTRGSLSFFNELKMDTIKRFYVIDQDTEIIRGWQGHKNEQKWFYIFAGTFKVVLVKPDDWGAPSADLEYKEFTISHKDLHVLHVPIGYATAFKAIEDNSRLMIFSDHTLKESMEDDFRFDKNMWYKW